MEKQNMSNKDKKVLNRLIKNRNEEMCVNDTDENLRAISADKEDVVLECCRQLHGKKQKSLIDKIKFDLKNIVRKHMEKRSCSFQEAKLLLF